MSIINYIQDITQNNVVELIAQKSLYISWFILTLVYIYDLYQENYYTVDTLYILIFNIIVSLTNVKLKNIIKQPRPVAYNVYNGILRSYGMPSVHCACLFSLTTFLFYTRSIEIFVISLLFSTLVAFQRINSYHHTKEQVIAGILSGYIMSFLIYKFIILYLINVN